MKRALYLIVLLVTLIASVACSSSDPVVGDWYLKGKYYSYNGTAWNEVGTGSTGSVPTSRILTIGGTGQDLSADRTWTIDNLNLSGALADGAYLGIYETGTAGATLAFGDLVYLAVADSRWELTDANAEATTKPKIGICVQAAAGDGSATTILLYGKVMADSKFPSMTIAAPVFVSEDAGLITNTAPTTSGAMVRIIGYGNTADELFFKPDSTWIELK